MPIFEAPTLTDFATRIFRAAGAPPETAHTVAQSLVTTNLTGHDSHGVIQIIRYVGYIRSGQLQPAGQPEIERQTGATAVVNCHWGFGQVGARFGAQVAHNLARQHHISCVSLKQVNHIGRLGEYSEWIASQGLIGIVITSGSMSQGSVAPYGGRERLFATNPLSWAVPTGDGRPPLVGDFATAALAAGKMAIAISKDEAIPPGVLLDRDGNPTTDPADYNRGGILLPFGTYKGYSMSLMIEIIAALLADFAPTSSSEFRQGNPTVMIAVDIEAFTPRERFERLAREVMDRVKNVKPADGFDEVLLPGELEARAVAERTRSGIPLPDSVWQQLTALAQELGVFLP